MEKKFELSKNFSKQYTKADSQVQNAFDRRFKLFRHNPQNSLLNTYVLKEKHKGLGSINITGDWRAIYSEEKTDSSRVVIFRELGTHSQLYR